MKRYLLLIFAGLLLFQSGFPISIKASEKEAVESALYWLNLVDQGQYEESWEAASSLFRRNVTREQWREAVQGARESLGDMVTRELASTEAHDTLPGAPDGRYLIIFFNSSFVDKKEGRETLTLMLDKDETWRVSGYFIR